MKAMLRTVICALYLCSVLFSVPTYADQPERTYYYDVNYDGTCAGGSDTLSAYHDDLHVPFQIVKDSELGNNVMRMDIGSGNLGSVKFGAEPVSPAINVDGKTTWYEVSFKFDDYVPNVVFCTAGNKDIGYQYLYTIDEEGNMYYGNKSAKFPDFCFKTGEWYHIVIAVDNINKAGGLANVYTWINGEQIKFSGSFVQADGGYRYNFYKGSDASVTYVVPVINLWIIDHTNLSRSVSMDNFRIYTTDTSVANTGYDPTSIFGDGEITSDVFEIKDGTIFAPADETLGEISESITAENASVSYKDDSGLIDENDLAVTPALGAYVCIGNTGATMPRKFKIKEGLRLFDIKRDSVRWTKNDGEELSTVSGLSEGDKVKVSFDFRNDTKEDKTCFMVFAKYDGNTLCSYSLGQISVPVGGCTAESDSITVEKENNIRLKLYVWNSSDDYTPLVSRVEFE